MSDQFSIEDWELLGQVCQAYRNLTDSLMDEIAVHRAQGIMLCRLFHNEGITQSEIGDLLNVQGATVTNMLQRMEESGIVTRQRDSDDNRLVRVYLTDKGREMERSITEQFTKLNQTIFADIDGAEREELRRLLNKLAQNMTSK